jgi:hypothetical protein
MIGSPRPDLGLHGQNLLEFLFGKGPCDRGDGVLLHVRGLVGQDEEKVLRAREESGPSPLPWEQPGAG